MQLMQAGFQRGSAAEVATAAASAGSFKDLVAVVPDFRAQIRVTSVATCKIVPVPGVAPTMDELFWRELQYTSVKKEGHFKAAAFTTGGAGEEWGHAAAKPFVVCLFPRNHKTTQHIWVFDPSAREFMGLAAASLMLFNTVRGVQVGAVCLTAQCPTPHSIAPHRIPSPHAAFHRLSSSPSRHTLHPPLGPQEPCWVLLPRFVCEVTCRQVHGLLAVTTRLQFCTPDRPPPPTHTHSDTFNPPYPACTRPCRCT
jgi:hypothetical protein